MPKRRGSVQESLRRRACGRLRTLCRARPTVAMHRVHLAASSAVPLDALPASAAPLPAGCRAQSAARRAAYRCSASLLPAPCSLQSAARCAARTTSLWA